MRAVFNHAALIAATIAFISCPAVGASISQPAGFYVMQALHQTNVSDAVLSSPNIVGVHLRDRWSQVEPTSATDSFTWLDDQIARAKGLGQQVTLGIYTGVNSPAWLNVPLWDGVPIPWDPAVNNAHSNMVALLGEHYRNETAITAVHISSPATNRSLEMFLPDGLTSFPGYSDAKIIDTWKSAIDAYSTAFPYSTLVLDVAMAPDVNGAITDAVTSYAQDVLGDRVNFIHCSLKATTNQAAPHHQTVADLHRAGSRIGFEMVGPSIDTTRFGGSFADAIALGQAAGSSWYQIYQADIPAIPANFFSIPGDYDHNGVVDAGDYIVWRNTLGSTNLIADGDSNGRVDQMDYATWRLHMGEINGAAVGGSFNIPEPPSSILFALALSNIGFANHPRVFGRRRRPIALLWRSDRVLR